LHIAGDYNASDYWLNRNDIGDKMLEALETDLGVAYANVSGFMMIKIDLPDIYEGAIVNTEVTNQEKTTYETLRSVNETQQETENIKAAGLAQINIIQANATSIAT